MKTVGGSLASDDLYLLDLRQGEEQAQWIIVPVVGPTPGRRYGHVMTFCNPHLFVFGGNTGSDPVNDVWCLSVEKAPFAWSKITCSSDLPPARVYHSAAQCITGSAAGMMVIFGGRSADQSALNDTWGLRKHRDGTWDWVKAPYKPGGIVPIGRYQHSSLFLNSVMVVIGGRTNSVGKMVPFEAYDTETSEWFSFQPVKRFRHSVWSIEGMIYIYGGFQQDSPNVPTDIILRVDSTKLFKLECSLSGQKEIQKEESKASPTINTMGNTKPNIVPIIQTPSIAPKILPKNTTPINPLGIKSIKKPATVGATSSNTENIGFRLASQVHVATSFNMEDPESDLANFIKKVPVEQLQEEARKLGGKPKLAIAEAKKAANDSLFTMFINHLLKPKDYSLEAPNATFVFRKDYVIELVKEFQALLESQPMIINLRTPVKIFGNIHGNFQDLMRIFELWKSPTENALGGDIDSLAYLFLGNYVDRGNRGLETICLLMALKLKYPETVYLLRGSHEDRLINAVYGFGEECTNRLHENINEPGSIFQMINNAFAWLPIAATIEKKIFCIHGGIGPNINKIEDLNKISRPIELSQEISPIEQGILLNALWSDPAESEVEFGYKRNHFRNTVSADHIFKFGSDIATQFLQANGLELMIRAHEIAINGMDTFADSKVITVTSCSDYCGKLGNTACILVIQKTFEIVPKLLLPTPSAGQNTLWIDNEESLKKRPLTPPRQKLDSGEMKS